MNDSKKIKEYIKAISHMKLFLEDLLKEQNRVIPAPKTDTEKLTEITNLRYLLKSNEWPEAVPPDLISLTEEDQYNQAEGIVREYLNTTLIRNKFLNYGFNDKIKDIVAGTGATLFEHAEDLNFNSDELFDVILCYDVLDDVDNPVEVLKKLKSLKSEKGKIFVRFHPWTSRHGAKLYKTLNKAYVQLIFNEKELASVGLINSPCVNKSFDLKIYDDWIKEAELNVVKKSTVTQDLESFFVSHNSILRRIKNNFHDKGKFPDELLEVQFVDYILN